MSDQTLALNQNANYSFILVFGHFLLVDKEIWTFLS